MSFSFFLSFFRSVGWNSCTTLTFSHDFWGETGDSALFIDLSVCSVWRVVKSEVCLVYYFFFCPHKMKGLNAKVRRSLCSSCGDATASPASLRQDGGSDVYVLYVSAVYMSCLMPTKMLFIDANELCSGDLCRDSSFSGGFLGNKKIILLMQTSLSVCVLSFAAVRRRRREQIHSEVCSVPTEVFLQSLTVTSKALYGIFHHQGPQSYI